MNVRIPIKQLGELFSDLEMNHGSSRLIGQAFISRLTASDQSVDCNLVIL